MNHNPDGHYIVACRWITCNQTSYKRGDSVPPEFAKAIMAHPCYSVIGRRGYIDWDRKNFCGDHVAPGEIRVCRPDGMSQADYKEFLKALGLNPDDYSDDEDG